MDELTEYHINPSTYDWTLRALEMLRKRLKVNIKLHDDQSRLNEGDIFLFNHFARFETFIPQYLIYKANGAYCRSVAASELFHQDSAFSSYLKAIGGIPNNHPRLLPFLAEEVIRGRKVIIFPEGGMVKDKRVLDAEGTFSIYSRTAKARRKHHSGAAVLGLVIEAFKIGIRGLEQRGDHKALKRWADTLGMGSVGDLLKSCHRQTSIVPSNITFYPIRVRDNILQKGVQMFSSDLSSRMAEELRIEGNILLRDTDMDLRVSTPIDINSHWSWIEKRLLRRAIKKTASMDELFKLTANCGTWDQRLTAICLNKKVDQIRDQSSYSLYSGVTINLSHLGARVIIEKVKAGDHEIDRGLFHRILYLAVKYAQKTDNVFLHRSLIQPESYEGILDGLCPGLLQFLSSEACGNLVQMSPDSYRFLPALLDERHFDKVRLENIIRVYANEMAPIKGAVMAVEKAMKDAPAITKQDLAYHLFDDEIKDWSWHKQYYSKPKYADINNQETATEPAIPYLEVPENNNRFGLLMVHGFLASPAELRPMAQEFIDQGHPVMGVRLKGHGTSPWDLRERCWEDWLQSVRQGYRILSAFADQIAIIGFSSGGALSLHLAAEQPEKLAGVASVSAPIKFRNKNMVFVPLVHRVNKIMRQLPTIEQGLMTFRENQSEHPHINYRNIPIRGLYELTRMVDDLEKQLPHITCPVTVIQGDNDHVVDPKSAAIIERKLGSGDKSLHMVPSDRHGILNEDIGETRNLVRLFIKQLLLKSPARPTKASSVP